MFKTQKFRYVRKLSPIERINIAFNETSRYNVEMVIEGHGEFNLTQWKNVVKQVAEANPGCRVHLKSFLGFCKWVDSGIAPEVRIVEAPNWDGYNEEGTDFMQQKFDVLNGGPVFDVTLIQGSPARAIIRGLHGAMDGRGLIHIAKDIFRILRSEQPIGSKSTITDLDIRLKNQDKVNVTERKLTCCIPALPLSKNIESNEYIWRRIVFDEDIKNLLSKMAVFLAAQARKHDKGNVAFTVPVDFRGRREEVNSTANLTGYLRIPVQPEDTPRDVMKRIHQEIRDYGDCFNPNPIFAKILLWLPIRFLQNQINKKFDESLYTANKYLPTGGIVSLGYFKREEYSFPGFKAKGVFVIPGYVGKLNVLIHNYTDETCVVFAVPNAYNKEGQLDNLILELKSFLGS